MSHPNAAWKGTFISGVKCEDAISSASEMAPLPPVSTANMSMRIVSSSSRLALKPSATSKGSDLSLDSRTNLRPFNAFSCAAISFLRSALIVFSFVCRYEITFWIYSVGGKAPAFASPESFVALISEELPVVSNSCSRPVVSNPCSLVSSCSTRSSLAISRCHSSSLSKISPPVGAFAAGSAVAGRMIASIWVSSCSDSSISSK
mmetsp:Transcript_55622/g.116389  ORF Transcript_55622/g.116389 Transcript_55622/m.116389 type:complete len:204 (+) Transcript_55622:243-854(+)